MIISGVLTLYDRFGDVIQINKYSSKKNRSAIIDMWKKMYPKNTYIHIKPNINDKN
jgi:hypothetical protein